MYFQSSYRYIVSLLLLGSLCATVETFVKLETVKNENNVTQFIVSEGHTVVVPNHHQSQAPVVQFSIKSTTIDRIDKLNSTVWSLKLNDSNSLDISVHQVATNVTEYSLVWHGAARHLDSELCLHIQKNGQFWYQGYQSNDSHWPMDVKHRLGRTQFNAMLELERWSFPGTSGRWAREFTFILEHLLLNSDGFALHFDPHQPLFVRRDPNGNDALMCFSVNIDGYYYHKRYFTAAADVDLKLRLFTSVHIRTVSHYVVHQSGYIPKPKAIPADLSLFRYPIWLNDAIDSRHYNDATIIEFATNLSSHAIATKNELVLEHYDWLDREYNLDTKIFPNISNMAATLQSKGVQLGGTLVSPRLATSKKHPEFDKYVLRTSTSHYHLWYIDMSLPEAVKFYSTLLSKVHKDYQIKTFFLKSFIWDIDALFNETLVSKFPSLYYTRYAEAATQATEATVVAEFAYKTQHLPAFTRLINYYPTPADQLLRELIPVVLGVSIAGYSFLVPYPVGTFDDHLKYKNTHPITEELYIRLLQATTFMPAMSFTRAPWSFSQKAVDLTKKFVSLHIEHADTIIELARKRVADGTPIIRPMWYHAAADDSTAFRIGDQFMLGENIIVAPVVVEGQRERSVYLPAGKWIDQHGKSFKGPGTFTVKAPLEELPYFKRSEH